ncbi:hypothetical protein NCER_100236 [Vairimorpha ceranae BRL01]|uniref:Uncharacterized protein n=1 Tax=Vairimorpha ceranae (strain BRL01) TaxID=578460 RepID=C4V726_VAIC1|nr:hypothetical protein NCER_100236 [Vairimorpha ceranae BRL01]
MGKVTRKIREEKKKKEALDVLVRPSILVLLKLSKVQL